MRIIVGHSCRLLIVTSRTRHTSRHCIHLLSTYCMGCCLWCWIIHLNHLRLRLSRGLGWLRALSWLIPCETKHVCQIFSELSCSWKASRSNVHTFITFNAWNSCRATSSIDEHTLRWVQTLLSVLSKHWWMWRWTSRYHTCIWDSSKMICFWRVHYKWGRFGSWQTYSICTLTRWFLFLVAIDKTLVAIRITTWCWTNATSWVLRFSILLSISKNSL